MSKHTPGPWRVCTGFIKRNDEKDALIVDAGHHTSDVAWIPQRFEDLPDMESVQRSNARLIAESPELLEIAKLFKAELDLCMVMTGPLADKVADLTARVNAAINRVEGN